MFLLALSLVTQLAVAEQPNAVFNESYKSNNRGQWTVSIPEVHELVNIIFAINPEGMTGDLLELNNLMRYEDEQFRNYYRDVLETFLPFYNEPVVKRFRGILKSKEIETFYSLMNLASYAYKFEGDRIVPTGVHQFFASDGTHVFDRKKEEKKLKVVFSELERFAKKSRFRQFYVAHQGFYSRLTERYQERVDMNRIWKWLGDRFSYNVDSYKVLISPLIYGYHCTGGNTNNGFTEIVMSVNSPDRNTETYKLERAVFTEIDENYANPVSARHLKEIDDAIGEKQKWGNAEALGFYSSSKDVFTEYFTWGIFALYAKDSYSKEDFEQAKTVLNKKMVDRGFIKFKEFSQFLLEIYPSYRGKTMEEMYPAVLQWMKSH